jgi:hypothetical protein
MTGRLPTPESGQGLSPAGLVGEALDLLGGQSVRSRRLFGGLMAGALIGAALAGMLLRQAQRGGGARRH